MRTTIAELLGLYGETVDAVVQQVIDAYFPQTIPIRGPSTIHEWKIWLGWRTTILTRHPHIVAFENAPDHLLYHEILHLHRIKIEGAPLLRPAPFNAASEELAYRLNNDLEHLLIIPKEFEQFPEAAGYWNWSQKNYLAYCETKEYKNELDVFNFAMSYLVSKTVFQDPSTSMGAAKFLEEADILHEIEALRQGFLAEPTSKVEIANAILEACGVNGFKVEAMRFDPKGN
ncbi:hypothetical protein [Rhizobium sp. NXC24]|uniref:hypothetical protein n=1 Tax=Rhizobium sp. NXC24 TaxID=2048897 RepID=UPI000CDF44A6|nr:hypothetical protein [Rhizobium sp. NXC24]AVA22460.1 hypothetical protein NXC24_CH02830 [Rhizobium sp. NXC24]